MVLNYYSANYIGWPIPAFYYVAKIQKNSDISKYFCKYFSLKCHFLQGLPTLFPWPSKKCYEAS